MMNRLTQLMASLAALFALLAPLCALACLDEPVKAAQSVAEQSPPPCHGEAEGTTSEQPGSPHDDCGCESTLEALRPVADAISGAPSMVIAAPRFVMVPLDANLGWTPPAPMGADLPPPDILRLKSTLLI